MNTPQSEQHVHYLNVDLEVEFQGELQPLVDELGVELMVQYHDRLENNNDFASFSGTNIYIDAFGGTYGDPDNTISAFCDLIEKLSPKSRDIWDKCCKREFDIGFASGSTGERLELRLKGQTLKRVVELGATIEITIYPVAKD